MSSENESFYIGKDLEAMSFAEKYHQWILDEFHAYLHGDVVEVGAGSGNFTSLLAAADIESLTSFEPSENMYGILASRVREQERITAIHGFFDKNYDNYQSRFDAAIYVNVLEHIEKDLDELRFVWESLKPTGFLCIFVPALSWLYSDLDKEVGHFRRYHKKPLERLVKQAGFTVLKSKYFDMPGILPWYLLFVLMKKKITGSNVSLYDKWAVPVIRKIESIVSPPLGKNILLVARKSE
jgi:SAM-dependent methyltransferase